MGKKLFVGNLSYKVDSAALERLFSAHGSVDSATVVTDRQSGQSRGFGFVEMSNSGEADSAIAALNGTEHDGRAIIVNEAKPREDRPRGGGFGGRGDGNRAGRGGPGGGRPRTGGPRY